MKFVQDNIWLFLIALTSGFMFIWPTLSRRMSGIPQLGTLDAVQLINRRDPVVVDVREDSEFKRARLAGSRLMPLKALPERLAELEKFKSKPILLVCQSGNRSSQAAGILKKAGFTDVACLAGGLHGWQQAGMPIEKG